MFDCAISVKFLLFNYIKLVIAYRNFLWIIVSSQIEIKYQAGNLIVILHVT